MVHLPHMQLPPDYPHTPLLEDYFAIDTAEERLAWLMERPSQHLQLEATDMTAEKRIPGCISGLWLRGDLVAGVCVFNARSESPMVQGVVAFLCELYSGLTPAHVITLIELLPGQLGLEGLLTTTRKRAVLTTLAFFQDVATRNMGHPTE